MNEPELRGRSIEKGAGKSSTQSKRDEKTNDNEKVDGQSINHREDVHWGLSNAPKALQIMFKYVGT
jgi:hypothetical protein